jgi:hypothetical protein
MGVQEYHPGIPLGKWVSRIIPGLFPGIFQEYPEISLFPF